MRRAVRRTGSPFLRKATNGTAQRGNIAGQLIKVRLDRWLESMNRSRYDPANTSHYGSSPAQEGLRSGIPAHIGRTKSRHLGRLGGPMFRTGRKPEISRYPKQRM